jgi:hypothetical protein
MGPAWAVYRAGYSLRRRVGWLERRLPLGDWSAYSITEVASIKSTEEVIDEIRVSATQFFLRGQDRRAFQRRLIQIIPAESAERVQDDAVAISLGRFRFFFGNCLKVDSPPNWHQHPTTNRTWPKLHWTQLNDFGDSDVKWLWELGRFGFIYDLIRAYRLMGDAQHAETFWELIESWREENPPNAGVHWMCGQECAFRALAWCFGLFGFLDAKSTTSDRVSVLVEMLAAHGDRIEGNIEFAVSQKNNHSVNEALALWTIGTMLPFLNSAERWESRGRELLEREAARQIYDDGSYVQHSINYHRLMLQSYCWALRLGQLSNRPFSESLRERVRSAAHLLYQLTDETSGQAPNYGSNDGALLFHLDECDFNDYRAVLAIAYWITEGRRIYPGGAWDESLLWFCGEESLDAAWDPPARDDLAAGDGGYYTLRTDESWGFTRCCTYRDRPAHADMLSVDLWWRGMNIVADPGTYSYNSAPPWNDGLRGTSSHNTVQVDGLDQMQRGPRFTWFYWTDGRIVRRGTADDSGLVKLIEAEHFGYQRNLDVVHRRAVLIASGKVWIVVDDLRGTGLHSIASQWIFPKAQVESRDQRGLRLRLPIGSFKVSIFNLHDTSSLPEFEVVEGMQNGSAGWFSDRYMKKESSVSLLASDSSHFPCRKATVFFLGETDPVIEEASATQLSFALGSESYSLCFRDLSGGDGQSILHGAEVKVISNG